MQNSRLKVSIEIEAADIPTMHEMTRAEYNDYLTNELLFVDHHDVLRSGHGEFPLAVTKEQLDMFISHLQSLKHKVGAESA
ncbi:hypothetical protein [Shewanella sp.]|uniref:hypothetical protein n=1 Tax=Shewanella sp. TaxID=50422 RepID=UPI003A978F42